ncbi:MAG: type I-E CRISPR-associated protein Cse1/CasA [Mailhella sp.]|nr:type I-E CRISPR-associated protein Cse1/CasA [Mailhella sp.]
MHQAPYYNLVDEPWIPILRKDGIPDMTGLADLFSRSEDIADLAVRPHERVALMRLLLCLCYASGDGGLKKERIAEDVPAYLQEWKDRFWLYHPECPFLQIATLKPAKEEKLTPFSKLDLALSTGNNSTLFDHVGQKAQMTPASLAVSLLTTQCFSPGGTNSQVYWQGELTTRYTHSAPCIYKCMLHVFVRGKNLLETLFLNIVQINDLKRVYSHVGEDWLGRPYWEFIPQGIGDEKAVKNATETFMGRLVPLSRAICLKDTGVLYGEALVYPSFDNGFPAEPTATVYLQKKGKEEKKVLLALRPDRAVWRELPALMGAVRETLKNDGVRGPVALNILSSQSETDWVYEIIAAGVAYDSKKTASIIDTMESIYPLRRAMLTEQGQEDYQAGVQAAEYMASRLASAVSRFRESLDAGWQQSLSKAAQGKAKLEEKLHRQALLAYWSGVEQRLALLFDMASSETQEEFARLEAEWQIFIRQEALRAYDLVCGELSGRHEQAYVRGRSRLTWKKKNEEVPA